MNHQNQDILSLNDIQSCFHASLSDDALITADLAAIYLGISKKTLARYRQKKEGPPYYQYPSSNSISRNQKVHYKIRDLNEWREKFRVNSTMEAAQLRGISFCCINDIESETPFWIKNNVVYEHAYILSKESFIKYLRNDFQVQWISWHSLFSSKYLVSTELNVFRKKYIEYLESLIKLANFNNMS